MDKWAAIFHYPTKAGVKDQSSMAQADDDAVTSAAQKRREERLRVQLEGPTLRHGEGEWEPVTLHDLSSQGFRTDWPYKLVPGDEVWLQLPGHDPMPAKVAWELDYMIGCKFDVALRSAVYARILNQMR